PLPRRLSVTTCSMELRRAPSGALRVSGDERKLLLDPSGLTTGRGDRLCELDDRAGGLILRFRPDERLPLVGAFPQPRVERDPAEQGRIDRPRQCLPAAGAKELLPRTHE